MSLRTLIKTNRHEIRQALVRAAIVAFLTLFAFLLAASRNEPVNPWVLVVLLAINWISDTGKLPNSHQGER